MLKRFFQALFAVTQAFRSGWKTGFAPRAVITPRPAWDNGTNYDIPTFLRRSMG